VIRFDRMSADAHEPGDPKHNELMEKLNEIHQFLGPWLNHHAGLHNDGLIDYTMALLVWVGTSIGFMRQSNIIDRNDEMMEGFMHNLQVGIELGETRAARIEAHVKGKGETRQ